MDQAIPPIGQPWPGQGGVNAGLMRGANGKPDYFLILAIDPASIQSDIAWGGYGVEIAGADCEFDGLENTLALLKSNNGHPASEAAAGLNIEGHNDFYLPSRREQSLLYANVPELITKRWHWSSTQYSANYAWIQHFGDGYQVIDSKNNTLAARAVRRYYPLSNSAIQ